MDIKQLENKRLCSEHFTADDFIVGFGMKRLKDIAIPIQKASVTDSDDSDNVNEHGCSEIDLPLITCQERSAIDLETPFVTESSCSMPQSFNAIDLETSCLKETSFNMPQSFDAEEQSCSGMQSKLNFDCDSTEKSTNADVKTNTYETSLQKLQDEIEILKQQLNQKDKQCEKAQNTTKQANVKRVKYNEKLLIYLGLSHHHLLFLSYSISYK